MEDLKRLFLRAFHLPSWVKLIMLSIAIGIFMYLIGFDVRESAIIAFVSLLLTGLIVDGV